MAPETARNGWKGLTDDVGDANRQAATSVQVMRTVSETLKEVGGDATAMGQKAQAAAALQKQAAEEARIAVAGLKTEYEQAIATGNLQLAIEKLQQLKKATDEAALSATDNKKKQEEAAQAIGGRLRAGRYHDQGVIEDCRRCRAEGLRADQTERPGDRGGPEHAHGSDMPKQQSRPIAGLRTKR